MSAEMARARPATIAFFTRRAISATASKSPFEAIGKPGLDDVDAHRVEQVGDLELLFERHRRAGALLAVAQGGVEDQHAVLRNRLRVAVIVYSFSGERSRALRVSVPVTNP